MNSLMTFPLSDRHSIISRIRKDHNDKNLGYMSMIRQIFALLFIGLSWFAALSQEIPPRPDPPRLVNDLAGMLDAGQAAELESMLVRFNDSTSNQIVVLTVNDLKGAEPSEFAFKVGKEWGVGQKEMNNGVVMLIKPSGQGSKGQIFIATGKGLEGAIPDAIAKRIIEKEMIPAFKQGDYYGGIRAGLEVIMKLAAGEITTDQYAGKGKKSGQWTALIPILLIILVFIFFNNNRNKHQHIGGSIPFWTWLMLFGSMGGGRSGGWSGGSGGFGGGGGGFGGFGGGGFGGGGAGGSW